MKTTVSDFRAAAKAVGIELSFSASADLLVSAGICERVNNGVALVSEQVAERDRLRDLNAELVAALAGMIDYGDSEQPDLRADAHIQARAALAKAKGTP